MRKLSTVFLIAGVAAAFALTGCGGGGGGNTPDTPDTPGQVTITGTVKDNRSTPQPIAGALVTLNGSTVSTNSSGQFSFTLPNPPAIQIPADQRYFYVSTRTLDQSTYSTVYGVIYNTVTYPQSAVDGAQIPLPTNVITAASGTVSLGTITLKYTDPNGPPGPPDM